MMHLVKLIRLELIHFINNYNLQLGVCIAICLMELISQSVIFIGEIQVES
jgi:hypothetical protein